METPLGGFLHHRDRIICNLGRNEKMPRTAAHDANELDAVGLTKVESLHDAAGARLPRRTVRIAYSIKTKTDIRDLRASHKNGPRRVRGH